MTADITALRIDVADLLSKPAARRPLHLEVPVAGLAGSAAWVPDDEPIVLDLMLERVPEGIVVRGNVRAQWRAACSVCLSSGPLAARSSDTDADRSGRSISTWMRRGSRRSTRNGRCVV